MCRGGRGASCALINMVVRGFDSVMHDHSMGNDEAKTEDKGSAIRKNFRIAPLFKTVFRPIEIGANYLIIKARGQLAPSRSHCGIGFAPLARAWT